MSTEIIECSEIIEQRKYYFSLVPHRLYHHLLHREVPTLPTKHRDYINELYERLDENNDLNRNWLYTEQLGWRYTALIKIHKRCTKSPLESLSGRHKIRQLPRFMVFEYFNNSVIVRKYDPFKIDDIKLYFQYKYYPHLFDFIDSERKLGANILDDKFLCGLADSINYSEMIFKKCIDNARLKNEQKISQ